MITVFAPDGVGEVTRGSDLAALLSIAVASHPAGPLQDGDLVVVTSKVVSKAEGRGRPETDREQAITAETERTVARRGPTRIVRTRAGLTLAAAGVDNSNVSPGAILLLPVDPDASAARLRSDLAGDPGVRVGVIVSDTAGRAWRLGQTDQAIGASGVRVVLDYAGQTDAYGNPLHVSAMAVADELAAAADLVKTKLAGRPFAVVRGLGHLVTDDPVRAVDLIRDSREDLFGFGSREAVLAAVLAVTDQADRYEEIVALPTDERAAAVLRDRPREDPAGALLTELLGVDLTSFNPCGPARTPVGFSGGDPQDEQTGIPGRAGRAG